MFEVGDLVYVKPDTGLFPILRELGAKADQVYIILEITPSHLMVLGDSTTLRPISTRIALLAYVTELDHV